MEMLGRTWMVSAFCPSTTWRISNWDLCVRNQGKFCIITKAVPWNGRQYVKLLASAWPMPPSRMEDYLGIWGGDSEYRRLWEGLKASQDPYCRKGSKSRWLSVTVQTVREEEHPKVEKTLSGRINTAAHHDGRNVLTRNIVVDVEGSYVLSSGSGIHL